MLFGIVTYGVHLTAYVEIGEERMREENTKWGKMVWIPRRSSTKSTYPGMLDNTVAGGMASGEEVLECGMFLLFLMEFMTPMNSLVVIFWTRSSRIPNLGIAFRYAKYSKSVLLHDFLALTLQLISTKS